MPTDGHQIGDSGVEPAPAEVPHYPFPNMSGDPHTPKRSPSPNFVDTYRAQPRPRDLFTTQTPDTAAIAKSLARTPAIAVTTTKVCLQTQLSSITFTLESAPTNSSSLPTTLLRPQHNPPRLHQPSRYRSRRFRSVIPYRHYSLFSSPSHSRLKTLDYHRPISPNLCNPPSPPTFKTSLPQSFCTHNLVHCFIVFAETVIS